MLTLKQKLEDFDYFWHILDTCFPVKGVAARRGYDWEAIRESSRRAVEESKDDLEFFRAMDGIVRAFKEPDRERFLCHLRIFEPARHREYQSSFQQYRKIDGNDRLLPWIEPLFREHSEAFYSQFEDRAAGIHLKGTVEPTLNEGDSITFKSGANDENVDFRIIEEGRIACIHVKTLNNLLVESDMPKIFEFLKSIEGYRHLIIDFRDNGGGATRYWQNLLVAPTTTGSLSIDTYMGITACEENRQYFDPEKLTPISELPELPALVPEDIAPLTHFMHSRYRVDPDLEHGWFRGKIWVLFSKTTYSSAESFAVFCRHSGWCTTIGCRTGGDGIGITPLHYCLPNSGITFRFSGVYGINPDGSANQVEGTLPHIVCDPEEAMDVCLREIAKEN